MNDGLSTKNSPTPSPTVAPATEFTSKPLKATSDTEEKSPPPTLSPTPPPRPPPRPSPRPSSSDSKSTSREPETTPESSSTPHPTHPTSTTASSDGSTFKHSSPTSHIRAYSTAAASESTQETSTAPSATAAASDNDTSGTAVPHLKTPTIIGLAVGGAAAFVIVAYIAFCCYRKRKRGRLLLAAYENPERKPYESVIVPKKATPHPNRFTFTPPQHEAPEREIAEVTLPPPSSRVHRQSALSPQQKYFDLYSPDSPAFQMTPQTPMGPLSASGGKEYFEPEYACSTAEIIPAYAPPQYRASSSFYDHSAMGSYASPRQGPTMSPVHSRGGSWGPASSYEPRQANRGGGYMHGQALHPQDGAWR